MNLKDNSIAYLLIRLQKRKFLQMVKRKSDQSLRILITTKRKLVQSFMNPIRNPMSLVNVPVEASCLRSIPEEISKHLSDVPISLNAETLTHFLKVQTY